MGNLLYNHRNKEYYKEEVWLSNTITDELKELLSLYQEEYPLTTPLKISRLCNMGLMMLASLSVDELKMIDNWFRSCNY